MTGDILTQLHGKLIVSSQAMNPKSPLRRPEILSLMAQAAELGGAGGFRVDGAAVVAHLRPNTKLPIIGIVKDGRGGFANYITTSSADVEALRAAGADIIAIQATAGSRPGESFAELAATAHRLGAAVMADVATLSEAEDAVRDGADMIATTMVGHTAATVGATRPPLDLLGQLLERLRVPVVIEGGVWTPEHVRDCFAAGAFAVVCGSAVTAPDIITRRLISGA
ncbi:MAG TPA: putative N-acetylmannosamine-6-phosphate 2-epimerase [Devosia sp.]|nr:putative N-acetylmannosamine-6-phosphate 2-epimerase [Devosia sp.]